MSTPGNQSSPGPSAQQYMFNNGTTDQSYQQGNGATNYLQQNQQQQYIPNMDHSTSSPIPGVSGGGGDPGPSSMAQQQIGGSRPQLQQQLQQTGLTPQQMAMFQQYSQGQGQATNGQPRQLTPQQLQIAMANIQAQNQGGNVNPQALMAAMRAGQQGQQGQQGTPGQTPQQPPQRPPTSIGNYGQPSQGTPGGQHPNPGQLAFQQQRIAQLMQQQQAMMARPSPGSPNRPSQQQQQQNGSMPPPPLPGTPQQFQQQQPGQFHLSQHQQQLFASQRQNLLNNPTFMALPVQQQQAYMATQQQQFFRMVASGQIPPTAGQPQPQTQHQPPNQHQQQPQYAQMQSSQHQPPPRPESAQGMPQSEHQSPAITRQPTPQQIGTPHSAHSQTPQQPMSSLPQHMAPPRPASAASQRAPSPHPIATPGSPAVMGSISTPPPSGPSYQINTPHAVNAPSPTHSNHSHHSHHSQQYQTPQPHLQPTPQPPHSASPMPARTATPNQSLHPQQYSGAPVQIGIDGQSFTPQQFDQQSQPWQPQSQSQGTAPSHSSPAQNSQQTPQMSLEAVGHGGPGPSGQPQNSSYGNYPLPPQPIVPTMENMTPQQQQQMATAMSFFSQAAQQQNAAGAGTGAGQGQGNVRPTMASRPTQSGSMGMPNINTSDFPFDPRLLQQIPFLSDTRWRSTMQTQNPQFLAAVQQAASTMPSLTPDVIQRMQAVLFHTAKIQASGAFRPPNGTQGLPPHMQQQFAQQGAPAFAPGVGATTQNSISATQQARLWAAQQGQNSPASTSSPSIRPPPPHLPPTSNTPGSPTVANSHPVGRPPGSGNKAKKEKDHLSTPSHQPSMPPPNFIPSHMISQRPPPHSAPGDIPPPTAVAHVPPPHVFPVKEWESALRIDVPITRISPLPINDIDETTDPTFKGQILPMTTNEIQNVKEWIKKDTNFFDQEKSHHKKNLEKNMKWAQAEDRETPWWMLRKGEMRTPAPARLRILWPADKERMRSERTHRGRMQIKFSQADLKAMANVEDHVVPVRLELEHDTHKLKDTFMWNCADQIVTPELFAQTLCDDFAVPHVHFVPKIVAAINERVREYQDQVLPMVQRRSPEDKYTGLINEEDSKDQALMEVFRRAREREGSIPEQEEIKTDPGDEHQEDNVKIITIDEHATGMTDMDDLDRPMTVEEATACLPADQSEELRILIKVDIIVGTQNLSDSFEWDLNSTVSPEEFATSYVTELGLSLEFATAIAHDIHEQVLVHKRSLFLVGHTFGSGLVPDDEVRSAFLPPVTTTLRREDVAMSSFTPIFNELREEDIAHIEATRDKEAKRKKRAGRARRGVVLPDREPLKTQRSLLNNLGPNGLPTLTMTETASVAVAYNSNTLTKRRAALDAQANINLLAQDLSLPQQPLSPAPSHAVANVHSQRGRKPRGRGGHMGLSRASPAFDAFRDREGSISVQDGIITPSIPTIGIKRFREDSLDSSSMNGNGGGIYHNSPIPQRKRTNHSRIPESPPTPSVKMEDHTSMMSLELLEGDPAIGWHCTHCGVPEYLAGKVKKDKLGNKLQCYQCSEHQSHKGKPRPCTYHEDEQVHRDRLMRRKGGIPPIPSGSALASTSTLFPGVGPASGTGDNGLHAPAQAPEHHNSHSMAMAIPSIPNPNSNSNPIATSNLGSIAVPHSHSMSRGRSRSRSKSTTTTTSASASRSRSPIKRRKPTVSDDDDDDDSDDDDDDDESDSTFASSRKQKKLPQTPSRAGGLGKSPMATASPSSAKKSTAAIELPKWISRALTLMRSKYPRDEFSIVQKPQPQTVAHQVQGPVEWRAKCLDCPGKIYSLGPGESLNNFEVHLKNRQHTANRLAREGKTA